MKKIIILSLLFIISGQHIKAYNIDSTQNNTIYYKQNFLKPKSVLSIREITNRYPKKLVQSIEVLLLTSSIVTYGLSEHYNIKYNDDKLVKYRDKADNFFVYSKALAISTAGTFVLDILLRKISQRNERIKFKFAYSQPYKFSNIKTTTLSLTYTL